MGRIKSQTFNGITYNSQALPTSSKFMIVNGDGEVLLQL
jgi:hypothetical protein